MTRAACVGLVLAATTLFRTAAVGLFPAMLVALALHRRWRAVAACGVGGVLPMVTWATLRATWVARGPVSSVPDDLGYWRWLGVDGPFALAGLAGRTIFTNAVEYVPKLASYLFSSQPVGIGIVGLASVAVAVACAKLWREHTALVATTLAASALTLLWPYAQGRLLLPLLPFLGLLAAATVGAGSRHLPRRVAWGATAALGLTALAVTLRQIELREAAGRAYWTGAMRLEDRSPALTLALRSRFIGDVTGWVSRNTNLQDQVPAIAASRPDLMQVLRSGATQLTESRLTARMRGVMVMVQVAVAACFLVVGSLFVHSLILVRGIETGVREEGVLAFRVSPSPLRTDSTHQVALRQRLLDAVAAVPDVEAIGTGQTGFMTGARNGNSILMEGETAQDGQDYSIGYDVVGAGTLTRMGVTLRAGRDLEARETDTGTRSAVVNEALVHPYPGENAWWARLSASPVLGDIFCGLMIPWLGPPMSPASVANNFWPAQPPPSYYEDAGVGLIFRPQAFRASAQDVCATKSEFAPQAPLYPEIFTPAIIVTAEKVGVVSPKRHERALAADLPAAEVVIAPDTGHMPHRLRTDLVLAAIRRVNAVAASQAAS